MCSTLKSQENIQKAYMKKETKMEFKYFIIEKKRKRQISTKNGIVSTKIQKETSKHRSEKTRKIAHHKLALKSNNSNPRNVNIGPAKHSQKPAQPEPLTLVIRIASR
jgi:hypothetical protein